MELYLFRHGIAEDAVAGSPDANRALTDEGKKKVAEVVKAARRAGAAPSVIISSPYVRAMETARVAAEGFGYKGDIIQTEALVPHGSPEKVWSELRDCREEPAILVAGHEPLLSRLVSFFLASPALRVEMKKAAMVRIDIETFGARPHGTLRWMITSKLCH
ncbi:MAG TPA: histidine phosphatase family protein [Bryobacteraceae bacterium]|jgi:phosphohistidine phosphatase|nr:histidine phosphatase family protein [Bryobacteraceae bacterium]